MQLLTLTTLLTTALATPLLPRGVTTESVTADAGNIVRISSANDEPASISFTLSSATTGTSTYCTTGAGANPQINGPLYECEDKAYTFRYVEHVAYPRYKVAVYHQLGQL